MGIEASADKPNDKSDHDAPQSCHTCPRLLRTLIVFHDGSVPMFSFRVQTELSFVVASLSFYSAHVSVDPTVDVRVMLD